MNKPTTRERCIDALDRIDQEALLYDGDQSSTVIRHSVEALTWILQNTAVNPIKLEVFVARMCDTYEVEGP